MNDHEPGHIYHAGAMDGKLGADLISGMASVYAIANYLDMNNVPVKVPPLNTLDIALDTQVTWTDGGNDLRAFIDNDWRKVESKHRNQMTFTSVEEFTFPTIIVDVQHKIDQFGPAFRYAFTNQDLTHALILDGNTQPQWGPAQLGYDGRLGRERMYYYANKNLLRCSNIQVPRETISPQWIVYPNGSQATKTAVKDMQLAFLSQEPFNGPTLAKLSRQTIALHCQPALIPVRIGQWLNGQWRRVESEIPWPQ